MGGGDDPTPLRVVGLSVRPSTVCKGLTYLRVSVYNPYINYLFYLFFLIFFIISKQQLPTSSTAGRDRDSTGNCGSDYDRSGGDTGIGRVATRVSSEWGSRLFGSRRSKNKMWGYGNPMGFRGCFNRVSGVLMG